MPAQSGQQPTQLKKNSNPSKQIFENMSKSSMVHEELTNSL